jgi:hypothetical protein
MSLRLINSNQQTQMRNQYALRMEAEGPRARRHGSGSVEEEAAERPSLEMHHVPFLIFPTPLTLSCSAATNDEEAEPWRRRCCCPLTSGRTGPRSAPRRRGCRRSGRPAWRWRWRAVVYGAHRDPGMSAALPEQRRSHRLEVCRRLEVRLGCPRRASPSLLIALLSTRYIQLWLGMWLWRWYSASKRPCQWSEITFACFESLCRVMGSDERQNPTWVMKRVTPSMHIAIGYRLETIFSIQYSAGAISGFGRGIDFD